MIDYSKLIIPFALFKENLSILIIQGRELLNTNIKTEEELNSLRTAKDKWKKEVVTILENSFEKKQNGFVVEFLNSAAYSHYNIPGTKKSLQNLINDFKTSLSVYVQYLGYNLRIIEVCDAITNKGDNIISQRKKFGTQEKLQLILEKLYELNDDSLYPLEMILIGNGVPLKKSTETRELAKILESNGYIESIGGLGSDVTASITASGCLFIENSRKNDDAHSNEDTANAESLKTERMEIFISHSNKDVDIAKELIELLRVSLNLRTQDIRCTSVDGYRLPAGSSTDEQLKVEIHDSKVLLGLISPASISSYYVLFELGARWGANKPLIPLITNRNGVELLKGPLQGINSLKAYEEPQLYQLVTDIGNLLQRQPEPPASYQGHIKKVINTISNTSIEEEKEGTAVVIDDQFNSVNVDQQIKGYCKLEWPENFSMQVNCIQEQKEAVEILKKGKPADISADDFTLIRKKAQDDWPSNFAMRVHQEREEYEALRKLRTM